jgi:hypothetical protein
MKLSALFASIAALTLSASAFAHGDEFKCDVPKADRKPQMELKAKLEKDGWKKVRQVKVENGCYEVYGFDENNKRAEVFFNPKTFEKVGEERKN